MRRVAISLGVLSVILTSTSLTRGDDRPASHASPRGVLTRAASFTPDVAAYWKGQGATSVALVLDEQVSLEQWSKAQQVATDSGLATYAWIEVARSPALADAHPDWMASPGGHHADWRRRFPRAPTPGHGEVVKCWPWVPIGYAPALDAHRDRIRKLLAALPSGWSGVFLNDLQAGPSSCGCGNDQCRWALDYGSPPTARKTPGDDSAAQLVAHLLTLHPGKSIVPVWVTECQTEDLPKAKAGTGLCGTVPCATGSCWPRYALSWNPLVDACRGPIALAAWPSTFGRDRETWPSVALALFRQPPQDATPLPAERTLTVLEAWNRTPNERRAMIDRVTRDDPAIGWLLALEPIDQSWEPRIVRVP
jgi:hypothetical protein